MSSRDPYDDRYDDHNRERAHDPDAYDDVRDDADGRAARRERLYARARGKVSLPAIFMIIVGLLCLAFNVMAVGIYIIKPEILARQKYDMMKQMFPQNPQPAFEDFVKQEQTQQTVIYAVRAVAAVLMVVGAFKMRSLQGYGLAMTGTIVSLIPLCVNECCCTMPFGIWSLIVLLNADVKLAFSLGPPPESF
jgi:hypothetical protein